MPPSSSTIDGSTLSIRRIAFEAPLSATTNGWNVIVNQYSGRATNREIDSAREIA